MLEEKKNNDEEIKKYVDFFNSQIDMYSNLSKTIVQDLVNNRKESILFRNYDKEQVIGFLENPQRNEKQIRDVSIFLYANSSHYRRLCNGFSKLATMNYTIIPKNLKNKYTKSSFMLNYRKVADLLEKLNLKYHLLRILNICMYQDVYYGLYFETEDSFDIIQINPDYCKISHKIDGCLVYSLNFDFFRTRPHLLESYGNEILKMYRAYAGYSYTDSNGKQHTIKGDNKLQWQEPSNQICIKVNEDQLLYALPPFSGIFPEILNLEDYKLLKKSGEILDRYKVLVMNIPTENGEIKFDLELAKTFYRQACKNIDPGIGIILSPLKVDNLDFRKNASADSDAVNEAESALWSSSGSNGALFGCGDKLSSSSLNISTKNDEAIVFAILRQVENWFCKYIRQKNFTYSYKIQFLNQSIYNENDVCDRYQKAATYGVAGSRLLYAASIGLSPSDILTMQEIEDSFDFADRWIPLKSSNTMSPDINDTGRPTNKIKGMPIEDTTEDGQEGDANDEN